MLHFFRKYQRIFYIGITFVIVISFSFFGTYSSLPQQAAEDPVAFTTSTGTPVKRSDVEALANFIGTDNEDKILFGGTWGPNFLNDGVIKKDFLESGLAALIAAQFREEIKGEWQTRLDKEKKYSLYKHPEAAYISTETAWEYFIPNKLTHYHRLLQAGNPTSQDAIEARINLYLDERNFPAPTLKKVLKYQEQQYGFVKPDGRLDQNDLFLFNHYTMDDWFGSRFLRLIAQFIINSANVAEARGYRVSDTEAWADLLQNSEISFRQNKNNPYLRVDNSEDYLKEELRLLGMDKRTAVNVWKEVLLFRRLFQEMGNSVFVSPLLFDKFNQYANQSVKSDLYLLPEALRISNFKELQKFEAYLNGVSKRNDLLSLPAAFLTPSEVMRKNPELVQKKYVLEIAEADKKDLQTKISVKEMWQWQVEDGNWALITKEFPDLGTKKAKSKEERFLAMDQLDDRMKTRLNNFSRGKMVDAHPEWISQALAQAEPKKISVGLRTKGGSSPFTGLENRAELIRLLDQAPLKEQSPKLAEFSGNGKNYYRIAVLERSPTQEILTYAEANKEGILDTLVDRDLKEFYDNHPEQFEKPFADVKEQVAQEMQRPLIEAIKKDYAANGGKGKYSNEQLNNDLAASLRFYSYVRLSKERMKSAPDSLVAAPDKTALKDQWLFEKQPLAVKRNSMGEKVNTEEALAMAEKSWSSVNALPNGDLFFYFLKEKGVDAPELNMTQIAGAHQMLGDEAKQLLAKQLLDKSPLSLAYMDRTKKD